MNLNYNFWYSPFSFQPNLFFLGRERRTERVVQKFADSESSNVMHNKPVQNVKF